MRDMRLRSDSDSRENWRMQSGGIDGRLHEYYDTNTALIDIYYTE